MTTSPRRRPSLVSPNAVLRIHCSACLDERAWEGSWLSIQSGTSDGGESGGKT